MESGINLPALKMETGKSNLIMLLEQSGTRFSSPATGRIKCPPVLIRRSGEEGSDDHVKEEEKEDIVKEEESRMSGSWALDIPQMPKLLVSHLILSKVLVLSVTGRRTSFR